MSGVIAWKGESRIDKGPIVCIVTNLGDRKVDRTSNKKIGESMVQTWILREDVSPTVAINMGLDESICGDCALRGYIEEAPWGKVNRSRGCYVAVQNAPRGIWMAYKRGVYTPLEDETWPGRPTRLGAYGDPAAIPFRVNKNLISRGDGWVGYSHQWKHEKFQPMRKFCMASVNSIEEKWEANKKGWRTFRVLMPGDELDSDEFLCPASEEEMYRLTCDTCRACSGVGEELSRVQGANVAIYAHGSKAVLSGLKRTIGENL